MFQPAGAVDERGSERGWWRNRKWQDPGVVHTDVWLSRGRGWMYAYACPLEFSIKV